MPRRETDAHSDSPKRPKKAMPALAPPKPGLSKGWGGTSAPDPEPQPTSAAPTSHSSKSARSLSAETDSLPKSLTTPKPDLGDPASRPTRTPRPELPPLKIRLQRVLADAGIAARRVCEQLILEGRVRVNGIVVNTLPAFVDPTRDDIQADGHRLPRSTAGVREHPQDLSGAPKGPRKVYVLLNKPQKVLTASSDGGGRMTVTDLVDHPGARRLVPVGRLEFEAGGMVLLTNDGQLINALTHPRSGVDKIYHVAVKGRMDRSFIADLEKGLNLKASRAAQQDRKRAGAITVGLAGFKDAADHDPRSSDKTMLEISVGPSQPRRLDELLAEAGVRATRILQVGLGPLRMTDLRPGMWRELEKVEISQLRRACDTKSAAKPSGKNQSRTSKSSFNRPNASSFDDPSF